MIAAPMAGFEPNDIEVTIEGDRVRIRAPRRGPHQDDKRLAVAEWSVGPYDRELRLPSSVDGPLTNVTYGNGVLVVAMPRARSGERAAAAQISLMPIAATRGEHVGHVGRVPRPMTTREHRCDKHVA